VVVSDYPVANGARVTHRPILSLIASPLLAFQYVMDHDLGIYNVVMNLGNGAPDLVANIGSESMRISWQWRW